MTVGSPVSELLTLIIGLTALIVGDVLCKRIPILLKLNIPGAVVGGILTSIVVSCLEFGSELNITFGTQIRDILILVFFVTLGFTAKIRELGSGGKPLFIICVTTILLLSMQNIVGIAVAIAHGSHPFYGLLSGSVAFVGGPGTALAWAKEASKLGLEGAELVAISAATFAVSIGALISGPVTGWIIERHNLRGEKAADETAVAVSPKEQPYVPVTANLFIRSVLFVALAIWLGNLINVFSSQSDILLPAFLCSLLVGMVMTNAADLAGYRLPLHVTDRIGDIALQVFLALSLMSLKISALGAFFVPLMIVIVLQVCVSIAVAYFVLFRALGKNYDAAVTVGGFLGYAISSMPVAMATMENVTKRYGPSPKAILWITLAGSFFVDLVNAFLVKGFVLLIAKF